MYCDSESEDIYAKNAAQRAKIVDILCCICFCGGRQNPKNPNVSSVPAEAISQGGMQGLGSPFISVIKPKIKQCRQLPVPPHRLVKLA